MLALFLAFCLCVVAQDATTDTVRYSGYCPASLPIVPGVDCVQACTDDSKCPTGQKCCSNSCGSRCVAATPFIGGDAPVMDQNRDDSNPDVLGTKEAYFASLEKIFPAIPDTVLQQIRDAVSTELTSFKTALTQLATNVEAFTQAKDKIIAYATQLKEKATALTADTQKAIDEARIAVQEAIKQRGDLRDLAVASTTEKEALENYLEQSKNLLEQRIKEAKIIALYFISSLADAEAKCSGIVVEAAPLVRQLIEKPTDITTLGPVLEAKYTALKECLVQRVVLGARLQKVDAIVKARQEHFKAEIDDIKAAVDKAITQAQTEVKKTFEEAKAEFQARQADIVAKLTTRVKDFLSHLSQVAGIDLEITEEQILAKFNSVVVENTEGKTREELKERLIKEIKVLLIAAGASVPDLEFHDRDEEAKATTDTAKRQLTETFNIDASLLNVNGPSNSTAVAEDNSSGLSGGAIAGIVIGCIVGVVLLVVVAFLVVSKKNDADFV